jgi:hypothetical protein
MSRYEFAVAVNNLYMKMMGHVDNLQSQIDALNKKVDTMNGGGPGFDPTELRNQIAAMRRELDGMKGWQSDIDNFKRLASQFEKELAGLGVDVDKLKSDVASLEERVSRLENNNSSVNISGDANMLMLGGVSNDDRPGLLQNGRLTGVDANGNISGITRDFSVLHELGLNLSGKADDNVSWNATLVADNTLNAFGNLNAMPTGAAYNKNPDADMYIYNLQVNFSSALAGQGFNAHVGRVGHQVGKFLLKRSDFTVEYDEPRWDNGNFIFDGGILEFNFGGVGINVFGGRNTGVKSTNNVQLNPMSMNFGMPAAQVDSTLGLEAMFNLGGNGNLKAAYIVHDSDVNPTLNGGINRATVFGADANFNFGGIGVGASFAQSDLGRGGTRVVSTDNTAFDVNLGWNGNNWGVTAGYERVEPNFMAYGSWGRIGTNWNPRNVQGFYAGAHFTPNSNMNLHLGGSFMEGVQNGGGILGTDDQATTLMLSLDYQLASNWGFRAGIEDVRWDFNTGTDPSQRWFNVGFDYKLGNKSNINIFYIHSDVDFKGRQGAFGFGGARYTGGLVGTQLSIRF